MCAVVAMSIIPGTRLNEDVRVWFEAKVLAYIEDTPGADFILWKCCVCYFSLSVNGLCVCSVFKY